MRYLLSLALFALLLPLISKGQTDTTNAVTPAVLFNEANYVQVSQGLDVDNGNELYAIKYISSQDSLYTFKKVFLDSNYSQILSKAFFKSGLPEGPFYGYTDGLISLKATYKNGKLNGERLTYEYGVIVQKAFFADGVKTGAWDEFNSQGQIIRKITYDYRGHIVSDVKY